MVLCSCGVLWLWCLAAVVFCFCGILLLWYFEVAFSFCGILIGNPRGGGVSNRKEQKEREKGRKYKERKRGGDMY